MWFRRAQFGGDFVDTIPKWHLQATAEGRVRTAACEYRYVFNYERPMEQEAQPERSKCCIKCLATLPATPATGLMPAVVRFPSLDEQARGRTVVPRNRRLAGPDETT